MSRCTECVKQKAAHALKELLEDDCKHSFEQWKIPMEPCKDKGGLYVEDNNNDSKYVRKQNKSSIASDLLFNSHYSY